MPNSTPITSIPPYPPPNPVTLVVQVGFSKTPNFIRDLTNSKKSSFARVGRDVLALIETVVELI